MDPPDQWLEQRSVMTDIDAQIDCLLTAELQFRLASAVRLATTLKNQPLDLPLSWVHGEHGVSYAEVALRPDQADFAAWSLHRASTFLMAVAMKDAIRFAVYDPKNDPDDDIRYAYQISRLIRNAFAHAPFDPKWSIDPDCRDKVFAVRDILRLDTTGLQDQPFDWRHYGGPLAMLRLSQFVRVEILKHNPPPRTVIPLPSNVHYQQGDLILRRVETASDE
jgi:hypothetical protein